MADLFKRYPRWVADPLYTPVKQFLMKRWEKVMAEGNLTDRLLAEDRYREMSPESFVMERVLHGPDGVNRLCLVRRSYGFARVDMEFVPSTLKNVLADFSVPYQTILTKEEFVSKFKKGEVQNRVFFLAYRNSFGMCLRNEMGLDLVTPRSMLNDIFFNKMELERETETSIDPDTLTSGTITIEDEVVGLNVVHLFIEENIREELGMDRIMDNFPKTMVIEKGIPFRHFMELMIGDDDVTAKTTLTITSENGVVYSKRDANQFDMEFTGLRDAPEPGLIENVYIKMDCTHLGLEFTRTVSIKFTIKEPTQGRFRVVATPGSIEAPIGRKLGITYQCFFDNVLVETLTPPTSVGTLINDNTFNFKTKHKQGFMFIGTAKSGPGEGVQILDVLKAEFRHTAEGKVWVAQSLMNYTVKEATTESDKLDLIILNPNGLPGTVGTSHYFRYSVSYKGRTLDTRDVFIEPGIYGLKKTVEFQTMEVDRINYVLIKDSGIPGHVLTDTAIINPILVDPLNGWVYTREDYVFPQVQCPSIIETVPLGGEIIQIEKYQVVPAPFKFMVNGEDKTDILSRGMAITSDLGYSRRSLDGWAPNDSTIALTTDPNGEVIETLTFRAGYTLDQQSKSFEFVQKYRLLEFTGNDTVCYPDVGTVGFKIPEHDTTATRVYYKDTRISGTAVYLEAESEIDEGLIVTQGPVSVVEKSSDVSSTQSGIKTAKLVYARPVENPTAADKATFTITVDVIAADKLAVGIVGETVLNPWVENKVTMNVTWAGEVINVNDPRLIITVIPDPAFEDVVKVGALQTNGFNVTVEKGTLISTPTLIAFDVEVDYSDGVSAEYKKVGSQLKLVQKDPVSIIAYQEATTAPGSKRQNMVFTLRSAAGDNITDAIQESMYFRNKDQVRPALDTYSPNIALFSRKLGKYMIDVTTNHNNTAWDVILAVMVGGKKFNVPTMLWTSQGMPLVSTAEGPGNAVLNVKSVIKFTLKQDQGGEMKPIDAESYPTPLFDPTYFSVVGPVKRIDALGNYSVEVTSTGIVGGSNLNLKPHIYAGQGVYWDGNTPLFVMMEKK